MNPQALNSWVASINALLTLGAPIAKLIQLVKESLPADQANEVLRVLLAGWQSAKTENDARIAELQAQIG